MVEDKRVITFQILVMSPTSYQLLHSALLWRKYRAVRGIIPN